MREHLGLDQWVLGRHLQVRVEVDHGRARLLGEQACLHGAQAQVPLTCRFVVGLGYSGVQLDQQLAFLDALALAHQHFLDDAALLMLHGPALGVDGDHARTGHAFVQGRECRPQQEAAEPDGQCPETYAARARGGVPCGGVSRWRRIRTRRQTSQDVVRLLLSSHVMSQRLCSVIRRG